MKRKVDSCVLLLVSALLPAALFGQGVQTGTLKGTITSPESEVVTDAEIAVSSAALQGERTTMSDVNGVYVLSNLPPGRYTVRISKAGLNPVELSAEVPLGATAMVDATIGLVSVAETVLVEGIIPPPVTESQSSANIRAAEISTLPVGRTPFLVAELMPGLTNNAPNQNQITISGGFGFDNVFLIDGVDVNDNLLGSSNDLFIEDAIGEVQVLTSGISAEYGRFSGGVVNIITKTGGNSFAGSYRTTIGRPSWTSETPFERTNDIERGKPTTANPHITNDLSTFTELTLGGPVVRDRIWFFGAGRFESSSTAGTLPQTAVPYTKTNDNKRYEGKVTGTVRSGHTLQGSFLDNRVHRANEPVLSFSIDKETFISPSTPNHLAVMNYSGAISSRMLVNAQYSQKHFSTEGVGGTSTNIVDSPFLTRSGGQFQYNAPLFDATDPEERNNRQLTASVTYFASDRRFGSHELKGGLEHFVDQRVGANSQSATGYVFQSNFKIDATGAPVLDADGYLIPLFVPGTSRIQRWIAHRGAEFNMATMSAYVQDRWVATPRLTLGLGMRFEHTSSEATGGSTNVSVSRIVPRLGASYDLRGDSRTIVHATFSQYSGKYNVQQLSRNTNVGNSDRYSTLYRGPAGEGRSFAPGFDVSNYSGVVAGSFPALNISFADDLSSPVTTEYTVGAGRTFGRSYVKATFVQRNTKNLIEEFISFANGTSPIAIDGVTVGELDNIVYDNTDEPKRDYRAVQFSGQHRPANNISLNGHLTVQLRNHGNFEGELPNPTGSPIGDYPELLSLARSAPEGRLDDFQRSKLRLWGMYDLALGQYGSLSVAPIFRYDSARTYSLALSGQALSAIQAARNPGYAGTPTQTLFFDERGSESFAGYGLVDLAITYAIPVWKSARPWVKVEAFNLFNNQKLIAWDTTITADPASSRDADGLLTGHLQGARFGQGTSNVHYPAPRPGDTGGRMVDVAVGFRF
jgi:hypothetical protein